MKEKRSSSLYQNTNYYQNHNKNYYNDQLYQNTAQNKQQNGDIDKKLEEKLIQIFEQRFSYLEQSVKIHEKQINQFSQKSQQSSKSQQSNQQFIEQVKNHSDLLHLQEKQIYELQDNYVKKTELNLQLYNIQCSVNKINQKQEELEQTFANFQGQPKKSSQTSQQQPLQQQQSNQNQPMNKKQEKFNLDIATEINNLYGLLKQCLKQNSSKVAQIDQDIDKYINKVQIQPEILKEQGKENEKKALQVQQQNLTQRGILKKDEKYNKSNPRDPKQRSFSLADNNSYLSQRSPQAFVNESQQITKIYSHQSQSYNTSQNTSQQSTNAMHTKSDMQSQQTHKTTNIDSENRNPSEQKKREVRFEQVRVPTFEQNSQDVVAAAPQDKKKNSQNNYLDSTFGVSNNNSTNNKLNQQNQDQKQRVLKDLNSVTSQIENSIVQNQKCSPKFNENIVEYNKTLQQQQKENINHVGKQQQQQQQKNHQQQRKLDLITNDMNQRREQIDRSVFSNTCKNSYRQQSNYNSYNNSRKQSQVQNFLIDQVGAPRTQTNNNTQNTAQFNFKTYEPINNKDKNVNYHKQKSQQQQGDQKNTKIQEKKKLIDEEIEKRLKNEEEKRNQILGQYDTQKQQMQTQPNTTKNYYNNHNSQRTRSANTEHGQGIDYSNNSILQQHQQQQVQGLLSKAYNTDFSYKQKAKGDNGFQFSFK